MGSILKNNWERVIEFVFGEVGNQVLKDYVLDDEWR